MKTLAKLPVTIVTGFLGAGKTTLLRHLLANAGGRRIAVIVNEFGELGIDGEILKQCSIGCSEEEANGRVFELANGCLCCTVQEEFFPVMRELVARRGDLDHILIETSGLALPKPLVQAFNWPEIRTACTVDAVITVVDSPAVAAGTFAAFPEQVDAQRRADPNLDHESPLHELFADQLASADLVLLNKTDLLDAAGIAAVRAAVTGRTSRKPSMIEAKNGEVPSLVLLGIGASTEDDIENRKSHHELEHEALHASGEEHDHHHDHDEFESFVLKLGAIKDPSEFIDRLKPVIEKHDILRLIGATGRTVQARGYLAMGISGAVQHLQGIRECRHVLAVNTDVSAPMVQRAELTVVEDVQALMRELLALLQVERAAPPAASSTPIPSLKAA